VNSKLARNAIIDAAMEALCRQSPELTKDMALQVVLRETLHHVWERGEASISVHSFPREDTEACHCGTLLTDANRLDVYGDGEVNVCSAGCVRYVIQRDRDRAVDNLLSETE
jgi:hypothetical protein